MYNTNEDVQQYDNDIIKRNLIEFTAIFNHQLLFNEINNRDLSQLQQQQFALVSQPKF